MIELLVEAGLILAEAILELACALSSAERRAEGIWSNAGDGRNTKGGPAGPPSSSRTRKPPGRYRPGGR